MTNYEEILTTLPPLIEENEYDITILSNTSALLYQYLENVNWVGFYLNKNNTLFLGPFQGKVACTKIPFHRGVCGSCATKQETILVNNVHEFEGHIVCDANSKSELCIPIKTHNQLYGVLDIDSPEYNRFNEADKEALEQIVSILENQLENSKFLK